MNSCSGPDQTGARQMVTAARVRAHQSGRQEYSQGKENRAGDGGAAAAAMIPVASVTRSATGAHV